MPQGNVARVDQGIRQLIAKERWVLKATHPVLVDHGVTVHGVRVNDDLPLFEQGQRECKQRDGESLYPRSALKPAEGAHGGDAINPALVRDGWRDEASRRWPVSDVAVVKQVYQALANKDVGALFELFRPDCVITQDERLP